MNLNEYSLFPTNPKDGDVYRDEKGIQWAYIAEVNDWGMDLRDEYTRKQREELESITDHNMEKGVPVDGLEGDAFLRWLDEN